MQPRTKVLVSSITESDRQRYDLGNIAELAESIRSLGLIQPIVITSDLRLIAGGRRLAAVKTLNWQEVDVVFREVMSEDELQELELAENVKRKPLSWQEHTLAIYRIHQLKQRQAMIAGDSWGHRETGDLFGMSKSSVSNAIAIAKRIMANDDAIISSNSPSDALRVLLQRAEDAAMKVLSSNVTSIQATQPVARVGPHIAEPVKPSLFQSTEEEIQQEVNRTMLYLSNNIVCANCLSWIPERFGGNAACDAIICDPPYAIDMDMLDQDAGGVSNISRVVDTHQVDSNLELLKTFVPIAATVLKPTGFLAMWCDPMRFAFIHDLCVSAGLRVQRWPIVWHKTSPCINQCAHFNYTKNVEFCLVARKPAARLVTPSTTCVITSSNLNKLSSHPFSKPPEVWEFLFKHLCVANSFILDPFMGVASSGVAAIKAGHRYAGCELDPTHHVHAIDNIKLALMTLNPELKL